MIAGHSTSYFFNFITIQTLTMNRFVSPLRYPGGKLKVVEYIKRLFEVNNLCSGHYIEPYAGGASVALSLLFSDYAHSIHINDIDRSIYAFWYSVLYQTDSLCRLIADTPIDMNHWRHQFEIQKNKETADLLDLGFSTLFLNRTNRSGILRGGVIGGKEQKGQYKMNARFNKVDIIARIEKVATFANRITLTNQDAVKLIEGFTLSEVKTLLYLDPPYYVKGRDLYLNYYNDKDHRDIARVISHYTGHWLISYDAVSFLKELYGNYRQVEYNLNYSAGNSSKGKEIMIYSKELILPDAEIVKLKKANK